MIIGDANLAEVSTYLKVGTAALVLAMIEDRFISDDLTVDGPVAGLRAISHDPTLQQTVTLTDGRKLTGIQLQLEYLDLARKFVEDRHGADADPQTMDVLARWESVLDRLERDPMLLRDELDWVAKLKLSSIPLPRRPRVGRRQAAAHRPPVLRHPAREGPLPPARGAGRMERLLTDAQVEGHARPARGHPGLLPRPVPGEVRRARRRGILGLGDLRPPVASRCSGCPTIDPLRGSKAHVGSCSTA